MDSILILGPVDTKLTAFMVKAGYRLFYPSAAKGFIDLIKEEVIDLVLIDSGEDKQGHEWIQILRTNEFTRDVPVVALSPDKLQTLQIKELSFERIEILQAPFSLGTVVSKIAIMLRLRKNSGKHEERATLGDVNAALRDLNERHAKELHEAHAIQSGLLPKALPVSEKFEVAAAYEPLEEVGGDFYSIEPTPSGAIQLLSADVTGHGLSAAFIGSMTKLALVAVRKESPGELLQGMNALMAPVIPQGRFVTANAYLFNPETKVLQYARAGGPQAVLLKRATNETIELLGDGFPLGFFEEGEYPTAEVILDSHDVLVVVTDGITEAQNRDSEFFGSEGVSKILKDTTASDSAPVILETIRKKFKAFLDGRILKDDVTVLVLKVL